MDWICETCNYSNFASRLSCNKCKTNKINGIPSPYKKNDWACEKCNELNFGSRIQCRKCDNKPEHLGALQGAHLINKLNEKYIKDWICNNCKEINFSFRDSCRKCLKYQSVTKSDDKINKNQVTVATWNICNDKRCEKNKHTQWDNRCNKIIAMINNDKYDVVCLQELRNHDTSIMRIKGFLNSLTKYDYSYTPYCEFNTSFYVAILYNSAKFIPVAYDQFHYNNCPENDKICYGVKLKFKNSNNYFWVYTTHLSMDSNDKTRSMNIIADKLGKSTEPVIIAGDYNLFNDDNGDMLRHMATQYFEDMAYPLNGLQGTFIGFDDDEHKAKSLLDMSRLDYIFCRNIKKVNDAEAVDFTAETLNKRDYPSDHLMITVTLVIPDTNINSWV